MSTTIGISPLVYWYEYYEYSMKSMNILLVFHGYSMDSTSIMRDDEYRERDTERHKYKNVYVCTSNEMAEEEMRRIGLV